jgi:hypothetical protein
MARVLRVAVVQKALLLCHAVLCRAAPCCAVLCRAALCCAVAGAMPCRAVLTTPRCLPPGIQASTSGGLACPFVGTSGGLACTFHAATMDALEAHAFEEHSPQLSALGTSLSKCGYFRFLSIGFGYFRFLSVSFMSALGTSLSKCGHCHGSCMVAFEEHFPQLSALGTALPKCGRCHGQTVCVPHTAWSPHSSALV